MHSGDVKCILFLHKGRIVTWQNNQGALAYEDMHIQEFCDKQSCGEQHYRVIVRTKYGYMCGSTLYNQALQMYVCFIVVLDRKGLLKSLTFS